MRLFGFGHSVEHATSDSGSSGEDLEVQQVRSLNVRRKAAAAIGSFKTHHKAFYSNAALAVSVGFWVAVFALPTFSDRAKYLVFGQEEATHVIQEEAGNRTQIVKCGFTDILWDTDPYTKEERWCGFLPRKFSGFWDNIAQMIIFTVYRNTGTTINLAWQGVIGTLCACVNLWMMTLIYPNGAHSSDCTSEMLNQGQCIPDDPHYSSALVWFDTLGVLFLFLLSKSNANTIKFGMSWHVFFMMEFMNPTQGVAHGDFSFWGSSVLQFDDEASLVRYTSYAGALIAILVTFVPRPLSNMRGIFDNSEDVTNSICHVVSSSIDYLCAQQDDVQCKLRVEKEIDNLDVKVASVNEDLDGAWWETCGAGHRGNRRDLVLMYDKSSSDIQQVMFTLKTALANTDFDEKDVAFYGHMQVPMMDLQRATAELMKKCLEAIKDGNVDESERQDILASIEDVSGRGKALWAAYGKAVQHLTVEDIAGANASVFALSKWSRGVVFLAQDLLDAMQFRCNILTYAGQLLQNLKEGLISTWSPNSIAGGTKITKEFPFLHLNAHLKYCFRNYIPITICFLMGYAGMIDAGYNATMANTLALLITPYAGGAFQKNTLRLLGVSLGKTLPIILMILIRTWHDNHAMRHFSQWMIIWVFVSANVYVYYTSLQWSLVGCLVAGFGIVGLMKPSLDYSDAVMAKGYKEIGAVVLAIFIQLASDALLRHTTPRDTVGKEIGDMGSDLTTASKAYFEGDVEEFEEALDSAFKHMETLESTTPQTDPRLLIAPGYQTAFKMDLLKSVLPILKMMLSDFSSLRDCFSGQRETSEELKSLIYQTHERLAKKPAMGRVEDKLEQLLGSAFEIMTKVLLNGNETPVEVPTIKNLPPELLAEQRDLYNEIVKVLSEAAEDSEVKYETLCRHGMAVRSLLSAIQHLHASQLLFVKENI